MLKLVCSLALFAWTYLLFTNVNFVLSKPLESGPGMSDIENEIVGIKVELKNTNVSEYRAEYAKKMLSYMNQSIDPCEDFYEYACGNWKNIIEEKQVQHKRNNLLDIIYKLGDAMDELLQKSSSELHPEYAAEIKLAQQFYRTCLNADLYPIKKSSEYLNIINAIGGFPAVNETWDPDSFSWFNMSAHLTNYGAKGLVNEEIIPQYPFPPYFKLPELGFNSIVHSDNIASNTSRAFVLNESQMRKYLTAYGVEEDKISDVISGIFAFWRDALKIADQFDEDLAKCQLIDEGFDTETFAEWDNYFDIAWMGINFNLTEDDCPCDFYYIELDRICKNYKYAVANYLAMKFLYRMDAKLESSIFQKEYCIMNLHNVIPYLIDKLYLQDYFTLEIREEITGIVMEIQKSLRKVLEEADWLDESTRAEALLKESTIISRIGNYEDPVMTDRLIREMNKLAFVKGNYDSNNINLRKFGTFMKRYNGLHSESLDANTKPLELLVASQVNAFYYNVDNSINVMAGILHPPAYHKSWPNSLKFGTLGYLVGHEFTHGFDTTGALFDSIGDERYWWSKKSGKAFDERANCYVHHFNNYLVPEINRNINGNQTKDENIADSGGLREALNAYRSFIKDLSKEYGQNEVLKAEVLPEMGLSPERLFFLGFAQLWCASYKEEHFWEELLDEHTMDKYRVLGALTNFDEFAKSFECAEGSKMNPKVEKCRVW